MNPDSDASVPNSVLDLTKLNDDDFSLDDLANEYLQDKSSPSPSTEQSVTSTDSAECDTKLNDPNKNLLSSVPSTPGTHDLSPSLEDIMQIKSPLDSILFSNRLSSHDAADDADCIWKEESSELGKIFCTKIDQIETNVTKRISTCLFDRNLYDRVTHLVALLPKEYVRNSFQQFSVRPNAQNQQHRNQRYNNENRRPMHRPTFQQNLSNANSPSQRPANSQNYRQYPNPGGQFVDRRQQQQQQQNWYPTSQSSPSQSYNPRPQQPNRHSIGPPSAQHPGNHQQQQRTPQSGAQSGRHQNQGRNQQMSNDYQPNRRQRNQQQGSGGAGMCSYF